MPSVENDGSEYIHPLDEDAITDEDRIMLEGLQARLDGLREALKSEGHDLSCLTSDYFLHQRKDDTYDHPTT